MLSETDAIRAPYIVEPAGAAWRVTRLSRIAGRDADIEAVVHRQREVALAYADAAAALERYLASVDRGEDSTELFDAWRLLDDRYELLAMERHDAPLAETNDPWAIAAGGSATRH